MANDTLLGFVEHYNSLKGFGFIVVTNSDGSRTKYFVHVTQLLNGMPVMGSTVRFKAGPKPVGRNLALAEQVVILNQKASPSTSAGSATLFGSATVEAV